MTDEPDNDVEVAEVILDIHDLNRLQAQRLKQRVTDAIGNQTDPREAALAIVDILDEDPRTQEEWTQPMRTFYLAALVGCLAQSSGFATAVSENGPWMRDVRESLTRMQSAIGIFLMDELAALFPGKQFPEDEHSGRIVVSTWTPVQKQKVKELEAKFVDYATDQMLLDMATYVQDTLTEWH